MKKEYVIPYRLETEQKKSHWGSKARIHAKQKILAKAYFRDLEMKPPVRVTLTRIAPRSLDSHDNLRTSFKYFADAIAEVLVPGKAPGRADDCKQISWEYKQERAGPKEYRIKISVEKTDGQ